MKKLFEIKNIINNSKPYFAEKYGLKSIAVFGSYARGDETEISDVDLLVEFNRPIGLDFVTFADELELLLEVKVDVVTKNAMNKSMFRQIESDLNYV
ncbi:MAG: nucleotidyltransferase family protein [Melioribacteraceae bacterium]|nr:nucleotidyltransferase family protein [Melioribacteraceae bacterium]